MPLYDTRSERLTLYQKPARMRSFNCFSVTHAFAHSPDGGITQPANERCCSALRKFSTAFFVW